MSLPKTSRTKNGTIPELMSRAALVKAIEKKLKVNIEKQAKSHHIIPTPHLEQILRCKDNAARRILLGISR